MRVGVALSIIDFQLLYVNVAWISGQEEAVALRNSALSAFQGAISINRTISHWHVGGSCHVSHCTYGQLIY